MRPDVSVIVPSFRAAATIEACLASIFASEGTRFEVLVVDDASTDDTLELVLAFPCRTISLERNIQAANCRNLGAAHARAEVLVFFDADQTMEPETLREFLRVIDEEEASAVVGSFQPHTPAPGFFAKFKNLRHHYVHQVARREGCTLASGLTAIRKSVLEECGGFEPAFGAASIEDIALGYRMRRGGHRIVFAAEIQVTHLKHYGLVGLLRSDLCDRAIPWTALLLRERIWRDDLNTERSNVASVALAWLLPLALPWWGGTVALAVLVTLVLGIGALNAGLLRAAGRHLGARFALGGLAFLPLMYFVHGAGFLLGAAAYALGGSVARHRERPDPSYRIIDPVVSPRPAEQPTTRRHTDRRAASPSRVPITAVPPNKPIDPPKRV